MAIVLKEEDIVNKLEIYDEFKMFYRTERKKIIKKIRWVQIDLPKGVPATCEMHDNYLIIKIQNDPTYKRGYCIAHELGHAVLNANGFEGVDTCIKIPWDKVFTSLNNVLQDHIVDLNLKEYGYDIINYYIEEVSTLYEVCKHESVYNCDRAGQLFYAINIVDLFIYRDIVFNNQDILFIENFLNWVDKQHPNILQLARKIYAIFNEIGFNSPEKQKKLIQRIVKEYSLEEYFINEEDYDPERN